MFYLIRGDQRCVAETFDRATALVARGWELTTRDDYMARWMTLDAIRLERLIAAAKPPEEREIALGALI